MAWKLIEEHLDLVEGLHRMIYENTEAIGSDGKPMRFRRSVFTGALSCPQCGQIQTDPELGKVNVKKIKAETLAMLNKHHEQQLAYAKANGIALLRGPRSFR